MSKIHIINTLEDFDKHYQVFKNYVSKSPSELEAYIWSSYTDEIDIYFNSETLTYYKGNEEDFLCKVGTNSFSGMIFFPENKSIASISKSDIGRQIADRLNSYVKPEDNIKYTYTVFNDTLEYDSLKNKAVSYIASFPGINIHESPLDKRVDVHLRAYYPCNAFSIYLEIVNEDNMFVSKDTAIDTILSVLNNFLNENE